MRISSAAASWLGYSPLIMPIILLALHYIVDLIMIANRLATALLLATPRYSVSLSASLVSKHFDNNFKKARESLNKIAGSNSLSPIEYKKLFVAYPLAFKEGTPESKQPIIQTSGSCSVSST